MFWASFMALGTGNRALVVPVMGVPGAAFFEPPE